MDNDLISVIVPVYNVEQNIARCIESVLNQTYSRWELLLVDDGSQDKSGAICDEYARKDNRIRVFHEENRGVSAARNLGMLHARGSFVSFVDSDDWIECNAYEVLMRHQSQKDDDIVFFNNVLVFGGMHSVFTLQYSDEKDQFLRYYLNSPLTSVWNSIIKKELIDSSGIKFNENIGISEDIVFMVELIIKASKIGYVDKALYYYNRDNMHSITHCFDKMQFENLYNAMKVLRQILVDNNLFELYRKEYHWRVLQNKTDIIIDKSYYKMFNDFSPESRKYILSSPFHNKKVKFLMLLKSLNMGFMTNVLISLRSQFRR